MFKTEKFTCILGGWGCPIECCWNVWVPCCIACCGGPDGPFICGTGGPCEYPVGLWGWCCGGPIGDGAWEGEGIGEGACWGGPIGDGACGGGIGEDWGEGLAMPAPSPSSLQQCPDTYNGKWL